MKPVFPIKALLGAGRAEYQQIKNRYFGSIERFDGTPPEICEQILNKLWQGDFYRTSLGHFNFFWMRDFGTVAESLVNLGHVRRVHHTLHWALGHYQKVGNITLCIDRIGNTFNAPERSIDALPWLLHSLVVSNYKLDGREHAFLQREIKKYARMFLEPTGELKRAKYAEMRDAVHYDRSAYAISLVARAAQCAPLLGLSFPFSPDSYVQDLLDTYWNGDYFNADRSHAVYSSDSALMPFFLGIVTDKDMVARTCDYITEAGLNRLYPLQYGEHPEVFHYRRSMGPNVMPNYTGTTIWTWHATFYLHILKRYHRSEFKEQYAHFSDLIARHKTYPELVNPDGSWYYAPLYRGDPGMVWCALFLDLT